MHKNYACKDGLGNDGLAASKGRGRGRRKAQPAAPEGPARTVVIRAPEPKPKRLPSFVSTRKNSSQNVADVSNDGASSRKHPTGTIHRVNF